jgi:aminopeptidase
MKFDNTYLKKYAQLLLKAGINLQKGQNLYLQFEHCHWDFANIVAEEAYKLGANFVDPNCINQKFLRTRIENAGSESLNYLPDYYYKRFLESAEKPWARLALYSLEDLDVFVGIDQKRNAIFQKTQRLASDPLMKAAGAGKIPWVVCAVPSEKWAAKVTGLAPGPQAVEKMWEILNPILRLDDSDPVHTWNKLSSILKKRAETLSKLHFKKLHFKAAGTDLEVGLIEESIWAGGAFCSAYSEFLPNIPTEEVFTSPHMTQTQGRAQITRPVEVFGSSVEGAWFEFKNGKVVDFGAKVGAEQLKAFLETDENAKFLGEVALVDSSSPIFQSQKTFYSILLDENAACHIALGAAYPLGVANKNLSKDELLKLGFNQSLVHTDFMIGSAEMNVTGIKADGSTVKIIESGKFTKDFQS